MTFDVCAENHPRSWWSSRPGARGGSGRAPGRPDAAERDPPAEGTVSWLGLEGGHVGLLGADGLGRLAQAGQFRVGEFALHHPADSGGADLRLHAEVDAGYPVLAVDPRADRHDRAGDRKSTRLNSSHVSISYAVFCLKKK